MTIKPAYLVLAGAGGLIAVAGVKGWGLSHTFRDVVAGHNPNTNPQLTAQITGATYPGYGYGIGVGTGGGGGPGGSGGPIPPGPSGGYRVLGRTMAAARGWGTGSQWNALNLLWTRESGWSNTAQNPTSGAYGIPQALPYTKMPKAAWPPSAGGRASPRAQIGWGLSYIAQRYGNPVNAWAHEEANGWY